MNAEDVMIEAPKLKGKKVPVTYFVTTKDAKLHTCKECAKVLKQVKQDLGRVCGNLISHVANMHRQGCVQKIRTFVDGIQEIQDSSDFRDADVEPEDSEEEDDDA